MNFFLSYAETENLRHIIGQHDQIANRLESLAQNCADRDMQVRLRTDAEAAKLAQQQLLTFFN
ncbi:hypothetical protein [Oceanobacillus saliphilus]|uniref:hypothetical protein n=1 Tax=Oceanobacillus saliphilus TaxID=2925834 RepID=UPI00201E281F|nr:hypothetical protein [Oceanobacillus saliphilus]